MLKKSLLLVAVSAVSVSAFAGGMAQSPAASTNDLHMYAGAQAGYVAHYSANSKQTLNDKSETVNFATYNDNQGSFGARVFAGYMFNENLGLELGAGTFGSQLESVNELADGVSSQGLAYNYKTTALVGFDANVVGQIDVVDNMFAFGKAGMAIVKFKTTPYVANASLPAGVKSVSTWNWMPRAELGLGYKLTKDLSATVSYTQYFGIDGSKDVRSKTVDGVVGKSFNKYGPSFGLASAGLVYSF